MDSDGFEIEEFDSIMLDAIDEVIAKDSTHTVDTTAPITSTSPTRVASSESGISPLANPPGTGKFAKFRPAKPPSLSTAPSHQPTSTPAAPSEIIDLTGAESRAGSLKPKSNNSKVQDIIDVDLEDDFGDISMGDEWAQAMAMADSYQANKENWKPPPNYKQTTLNGGVAVQSEAGPSRQTSRAPFGRPSSKTKTWDRTAFAATGGKVVKRGSKGKGKSKVCGDDDEEMDEEAPEFNQFPSPFLPLGEAPPMKLQVDQDAAREWIYPLNKDKRDYQFNIVKNSLFENTLVALPTGLGKTFIAGTVMLNFYRWYPEGKILFVAPTKPLVAQQIDACHQSCGIPGTDAAELNGDTAQRVRSATYARKRVFYLTPQTLQNDLTSGVLDASDVILLVVDEAHRATGNYSYCEVIRYMMAKNPHFRVLALTATPGGKPEAVQAVVDNLHISHIEIRNEDSLDLRPYIHKKDIVHTPVAIEGEIAKIKGLLAKAMQPLVDRLAQNDIAHIRDVVKMHHFRVNMIMQEMRGKGQPWTFGLLKKLGRLSLAMGYLIEQSMAMCYKCLIGEEDEEEGAKSSSKSKKQTPQNDSSISKVIQELERIKTSRNGHFPTHPKLDKLMGIALDHFESYPNPDDTRVMVFCQFRACVDEIVETLNQQPGLRASRFVGQSSDKSGKKGFSQKEQLAVVENFKQGKFNILVATSIGEEGLDIGEVDLIICYDSQKTPIRMLQRIGRTGRKRNGRIEVLSAMGREDSNYGNANDSYKEVQESIVRGEDLELFADVERLVPPDIKPVSVEKVMEIIPYTKDEPVKGKRKSSTKGGDASPPPKKRKSTAAEVPAGAASGFVMASKLQKKGSKAKAKGDAKKTSGPLDIWAIKRDQDDSDDMELDLGLARVQVERSRSKSKAVSKASAKRSIEDEEDEENDGGGFVTALDALRKRKTSSKEPKAPLGRSKTLGQLPSTTAKSSKRNAARSASPITILDSPEALAPKSKEPPLIPKPPTVSAEEHKEKMDWLFSDDDEPPPRKSTPKLRSPPSSPDVIFKIPSIPQRSLTSAQALPPLPSNSTAVDSPLRSPDASMSFPVRRPGGRFKRRPPMTRVVGSDDVPDSDRSSPDAMQLSPSAPTSGLPDTPSSAVHSTQAPRPRKKDKSKFLTRINNAMFDMEADQSGDEESEGRSSDGDYPEDEYDRSFVNDGQATHAPAGYDQAAIYRAGLMTQAPAGLAFPNRPVRNGMFRGGNNRPAGRRPDLSSSPSVRDDDYYELGSFVVEDDDGVLDLSSEQ